MLRGNSGKIAGLKIPCGDSSGTRCPSNRNPRANSSRGNSVPRSSVCWRKIGPLSKLPADDRDGYLQQPEHSPHKATAELNPWSNQGWQRDLADQSCSETIRETFIKKVAKRFAPDDLYKLR